MGIAHDMKGWIETLRHGPGGAGDRVTSFAYHPTTGRLTSITDPASRVTSFDLYDAAGRVKQLTLPGSRVVLFDYDANGNLTSLTPPGRPAHVFRYTALDQEREYEPPALLGILDPKTVYSYNLDRQLELVTRPDGETVDLGYEATTGRLDTITIAEGVYDYGYFPLTPTPTTDPDGQLQSIAAPGGESLGFTWDGQLPLSTTSSGPVPGTVSRTFDNDFRISTESVTGAETLTSCVASRAARMTRMGNRIPMLVVGVSLVFLGAGFLLEEGYFDRIFRAYIGFGEWHKVVGLIFIGLGTLVLIVSGRRAR